MDWVGPKTQLPLIQWNIYFCAEDIYFNSYHMCVCVCVPSSESRNVDTPTHVMIERAPLYEKNIHAT